MAAKTAQNAPGVPKNGTMAALRRSSPELAKVRPGSRVSPKSQGYGEVPGFSPKPCRARGAGECCRGGWAARVADFGVSCRAICPTSPWNGGQLARFWREPAARHNKSEAQQRRGTAKGDFAKVAEGNRPYKTLERISASARGRNQAVAENNIPYRPQEQRLSSATLAKRTASAERAAPARK